MFHGAHIVVTIDNSEYFPDEDTSSMSHIVLTSTFQRSSTFAIHHVSRHHRPHQSTGHVAVHPCQWLYFLSPGVTVPISDVRVVIIVRPTQQTILPSFVLSPGSGTTSIPTTICRQPWLRTVSHDIYSLCQHARNWWSTIPPPETCADQRFPSHAAVEPIHGAQPNMLVAKIIHRAYRAIEKSSCAMLRPEYLAGDPRLARK